MQNSSAAHKISGAAVREEHRVSRFRRFACNPLETASVGKTKTDEPSNLCGTSRPRQGPDGLRANLVSWAITDSGMCLPKRAIFDTMQDKE